MTKIYSEQNVFDAALDRIRYLFDEFPVVVASVSGGKDSTVILELALRVAREKKRLPLPVFWIDQEAEWTATVDTVREIMHRKSVKPLWYQMPIYIENAASYDTKYLKCWDPEAEKDWIHKKDPLSIKENTFTTQWFLDLFDEVFAQAYPYEKVAVLAGVRCEENRSRYMGLTGARIYKWVTWAKKLKTHPNQYTFYPLYDWTWSDVWHAIAENKWKYNRMYDLYYQFGIPVPQMRISALHHETSIWAVQQMQEWDPALYDRVTKRLPGIATCNVLGREFFAAKKPPSMFRDWCDYRDFLIEKLAANDPEWQATLRKTSAAWDQLLAERPKDKQKSARVIVSSVVTNDYNGAKIDNWKSVFINMFKQEKMTRGIPWRKNNTFRKEDAPELFVILKKKIERKRGLWRAKGYRYWLKNDEVAVRRNVYGPQ
jgi:predicted phosphoadenosine phosphosulfate sulfurtransferase